MGTKTRSISVLLFILHKISISAADCTSQRRSHVALINSCLALITCTNTLDGFQREYQKYSQQTIKRESNGDYYHRYIKTPNENYCDNIYVQLSFGSASQKLNQVKDFDANNYIKYLIITDEDSVLLPTADIKHFSNLREIKASNNKLEEINLNDFTGLINLQKIDLSHNYINIIQSQDEYNGKVSNAVSINLSYNSLEILPNDCFMYFTRLKALDLSNNLITTIDILTFEGIKQLEMLNLSLNRLIEIGHSLARFSNLKNLDLNHNQLTSIQDINFRSMTKLETLNISTNQIKLVESSSFSHLSSLLVLDLSCNRIEILKQYIFRNNSNLHSLSISNNNLSVIEPEAFAGSNITYFDFGNNHLNGSIENKTFEGINVVELDLSNSNINRIGPSAFERLHNNLQILNLTTNIISVVSNSSFIKLEHLTVLDLSNNLITKLDFDKIDLKQLVFLNASKNIITKIKSDTFKYLESLQTLDLSSNKIHTIGMKPFQQLKKLKNIILKGNVFVNNLQGQSFHGLSLLNSIELMNTRTISFEDKAFAELNNLKSLNASHGELVTIAFNAFNDTESLEILDLSFNMLTLFNINATNLSKLREIYLNNNQITILSNNTFIGLTSLNKFDISYNDILTVENNTLETQRNIVYLMISYNTNMKLSCTILENKETLNFLSLSNVKRKFDFEKCLNITIIELDLTSCDISDINSLFVFRVNKLSSLKLSLNKITTIDKFSFQKMPVLTSLDLSSNLISSIQPGSFMHMNMLNDLDLNGNNLQSLPFGVFDNLEHLHVLNLSNNALHTFEADLLHNIPKLTLLVLDNNVIENIDIYSFDDKTSEIRLGGNFIPCDVLVRIYKMSKTVSNNKLIIGANALDFNSENVRGISCKSIKKKTLPLVGFSNNTSTNLTAAIDLLSNTIQSFRDNFKSDTNNTTSLLSNLINLNEIIFKDRNNSDAVSLSYLKKLVHVNNITNNYFALLDEYIKSKSNLSEILKDFNNTSKEKAIDNYYSLKELKTIFQNWEYKNAERNKFTDMSNSMKKNSDVTVLLYFIAVCLGVLLIVVLFGNVYSYFRNRHFVNSKSSNVSRQPMLDCSVMELE